MSLRSNGICMAHKNKKNIDIRCDRQTIRNTDFCKYHQKSSHYMKKVIISKLQTFSILHIFKNLCDSTIKTALNSSLKILDNKYLGGLLHIDNNWTSIPFIYWFNVDNMVYNFIYLIKMIEMQLSMSDMNNPSPKFPHDPYTRKNFSYVILNNIFDKLCELNLQKEQEYLALYTFLSNPDFILCY